MEKRIHSLVAEIRDGKRAWTEQVELAKVLPTPEVRCVVEAIEKENT